MKNKWKIKRLFEGLFLYLVFFILLLLLLSGRWYLNTYPNVEFSAAIYQLASPLEGTESGILRDYCRQCLLLAGLLSSFFIFLYYLGDHWLSRENHRWRLTVDVRLGRVKLHPGLELRVMGETVILTCMTMFLIAHIRNLAIEIDIPGYLENRSLATTLFEDHYVDPETVSIIFPEQRRNLLLIYLESMETSYASVEEGA